MILRSVQKDGEMVGPSLTVSDRLLLIEHAVSRASPHSSEEQRLQHKQHLILGHKNLTLQINVRYFSNNIEFMHTTS